MPLIEAVNVGKRYQITYEKQAVVRYLIPRFLRVQRFGDFWALRNVSFCLNSGEALGVIGSNGAGKSTLLNICAGITVPTEGTMKIDGKVASLLTLGAGFHPELSGEENIYLNGAILGLSIKEIRKKMDSIVQFSGLGRLMGAPLQTYSSGMMMRLGFSIVIQAPFDVLMIDEVMAVGDALFQSKCLAKLSEFKKKGKALILAAHDLEMVKKFCDKAILFETGRVIAYGDSTEVIECYKDRMNGNGANQEGLSSIEKKRLFLSIQGVAAKEDSPRPAEASRVLRHRRRRYCSDKVMIREVRLVNEEGESTDSISTGDMLRLRAEYEVMDEPVDEPHFGVAIFRDDGVYCFGANTLADKISVPRLNPGNGWFEQLYPSLPFLSGKFSLSVVIWDKEEKQAYDNHHAMYPLRIRHAWPEYGIVLLSHQWLLQDKELASQGNLIMGYKTFQAAVEEKIGVKLRDTLTHQSRGTARLTHFEISSFSGVGGLFSTGETLMMKGIFHSEQPVDQMVIWVGLFREDGILCYGTSSLVDGILFELNSGDTEWRIRFPKIPLLRGRFRVGLAWSSMDQDIFGILPQAGWFEVKETLSEHGLVSLKRKWRGSAFRRLPIGMGFDRIRLS